MNYKFSRPIQLIAIFFILAFTSCSKNPSPDRIKKKLTQGTWKISVAKIAGSNSTSTFNNVKFQFSSAGTITVSGEMSTSGSWYLGEDEKPAKMFLSFPATATALYGFTDDWIVREVTKRECSLTRNDPQKQDDQLIFRRLD